MSISTRIFINGLGIVGSHIARKAAELSQPTSSLFATASNRVRAIDRFLPASTMSSSHGESRITRRLI